MFMNSYKKPQQPQKSFVWIFNAKLVKGKFCMTQHTRFLQFQTSTLCSNTHFRTGELDPLKGFHWSRAFFHYPCWNVFLEVAKQKLKLLIFIRCQLALLNITTAFPLPSIWLIIQFKSINLFSVAIESECC